MFSPYKNRDKMDKVKGTYSEKGLCFAKKIELNDKIKVIEDFIAKL